MNTDKKPRFKKIGKLTNQPSKLIRQAIADIRKVETDERYRVDMNTWHFPTLDFSSTLKLRQGLKVCAVCFAGATMAKSLSIDPSVYVSPENFSTENRKLFEALNCFRLGDCATGLSILGFRDLFFQYYWEISFVPAQYVDDPELFLLQMIVLADEFESIGF